MNSPITYSQMTRSLAKPGGEILASLDASKCHLLHMVLGLASEIFELQLALASGDRNNIGEELGDSFFYSQGIMDLYDVEMDQLNIAHFPSQDRVMQSLIKYSELVVDRIKKHVLYNKELNVTDLLDNLHDLLRNLMYVARHYGFTQREETADWTESSLRCWNV
jgi:hypothetical protein